MKKPLKFERLQILPTNNTQLFPSNENNTIVDLKQVWNTYNENDHNIPILNERCNANETTVVHACQLFEICISNFTMLVEEVEAKLLLKRSSSDVDANNNINLNMRYDSMHLHHTWYDFVTVQVAFYGGLFIGTLFGAIILFTIKLISDCVMMPPRDNVHRSGRKRSKLFSTFKNKLNFHLMKSEYIFHRESSIFTIRDSKYK